MVTCVSKLHLRLIDHIRRFMWTAKSIDTPTGSARECAYKSHRCTCGQFAGVHLRKSYRCICRQFARRGCTCVYNQSCHDVINMAPYSAFQVFSLAICHLAKQWKALDSSVTFGWAGPLNTTISPAACIEHSLACSYITQCFDGAGIAETEPLLETWT